MQANDCHFDDVHERVDRPARLERPPGESPDFGVQVRRAVFEAKAPVEIVTDVRERLRVLLGL